MLAELSYPVGTLLSTVVADLGLVLCGTTDKTTLSAALDKPNSTIDTSKTNANWSNVATVPNAAPSANHKGGVILRQVCATSPGNYFYIRMTALYNGSASAIATVYGKGVGSSSNLSPEAAYGSNTYNHPLIIPTTGTTPTITVPIRLVVHSSSVATIVAVDINNSGNTRNIFAIMHVDLSAWYLKDATSSVLPVIVCSYDLTQGDNFWLMAPIAIGSVSFGDTATYGGGTPYGMQYGAWCQPKICSPTLAYGALPALLTSPLYKFSDHKPTGTTFDVISFGLNAVLMTCIDGSLGTIQNSEMFPYSSITDTSKVYLSNVNAFGKSGRYYSTAIGNMCKFEQFMVEVG